MAYSHAARPCALGLGAPVTLGEVSLCADMPMRGHLIFQGAGSLIRGGDPIGGGRR
jgi:hypothetical protein